MGILLRYPGRADAGPRTIAVRRRRRARRARRLRGLERDRPRVGVIGAGAFARSVLLPPLARQADIAAVATATGASARRVGDALRRRRRHDRRRARC